MVKEEQHVQNPEGQENSRQRVTFLRWSHGDAMVVKRETKLEYLMEKRSEANDSRQMDPLHHFQTLQKLPSAATFQELFEEEHEQSWKNLVDAGHWRGLKLHDPDFQR